MLKFIDKNTTTENNLRIIILSLIHKRFVTMQLRNAILALTGSVLLLTGCTLKKSESKSEREESFSERDEMEKAMEQEFLMTVDPALGFVPKDRLITALNYQKRLISARGSGINSITWNERGPNNISGRTRALLIDSKDASGNTVFAASVSGGIWKTTNFKSIAPTWSPVSESMGSLAVCALAQSPVNKDILYAGTGEGWFNSDALRGNGIWQSLDGGVSWNKLTSTDSTGNQHDFDFVQDIVVNNQGYVFAACRSIFCNRGGIFRSTNNGATWTRVIGTITSACNTSLNTQGTDLEIAANGDIYASAGMNASLASQNGHIFRSNGSNGVNVGNSNTWTDITPAGTWQRIEMALAPTNSSVVYALLEGTGDGIGAIKKSTDFGATWIDCQIPSWCNQGSASSDFTNGQAFYNLIAQVDPTNENIVVIGGIDLFKSTNGGASWSQITQWARNCLVGSSQLPTMHPDQHNVLFFPGTGAELIASNDGGVYYSNNGGSTWLTTTVTNVNGVNQTTISQKSIGYNTIQLYACDVHPSTTDYFLVGSQDNGSLKLTNIGVGIGREASVGGDGGFCHIDQTNGNLQVISYIYNNFYVSTNGGNSFVKANFNDNGQFINPSDLDDGKKVLYTAYIRGQLGMVSNLTGSPSFSAFNIPELGIRKISAVKVDPTVSGGGTIWIAGQDSSANFSTNSGLAPNLIKLTNANTSPVAAINISLPVQAGSYVSSIDVDPADGNHILVTLSNYGVTSVFESTNGGTSFSTIEGNLPDIPVRWGMFVPAASIIDGTTPGGILLATEIGVWSTISTAGSATMWTPQNGSLPRVRCDMLRYRSSDGLLAVATHGRGLFTSSLGLVTGIPSVPNTKNFIDYISATQQQLFVKVGNLSISNIEIRLFAMDGKLVYSSRTNYSNQNIPIFNLARGGYVVKIYGDKNEQFTKQFIK